MNKHKRVFPICLYLVTMASILCHAHDEDIASLIQQLEHTDANVRDSATKSLAEMGESAMPALVAALDHENAVVRHAVVGRLRSLMYKTPPDHKNIKHIVRAVVKAFKDDEYKVRFAAMECFFGLGKPEVSVTKLPPELTAQVMSGLVQLLYYGSPFFGGFDVGAVLHSMEDEGLPTVTEALHSSSWSLRFGAAIAYGDVGGSLYNKRVILGHHNVKPLPKAVIPILAEGLTHPDWKTQDDAARVLSKLHYYFRYDEARKALEALPPFAIVSQTIRDGDYIYSIVENVEDYSFEDFLNSLNTDGIAFKFNRSILGSGKITIQAVDGEPLDWNVEKSSHSVTIKPTEGKELVEGKNYTIQLRDVKDILGNQVDAEIEFSTEVPLSRRAH